MEPMDGVPARVLPVATHLIGFALHSTDKKPSQFLAVPFVLGNFKEINVSPSKHGSGLSDWLDWTLEDHTQSLCGHNASSR